MSAASAKRNALATALAVAVLVTASAGASAQNFGAIGFSPSSGALGWGFDYPTRQGAEDAAMQNCRKYAPDCKIAVSFENGCAAIAMGDTGYGSASSSGLAKAERQTLIACRSETKNCAILRWICTSKSGF